MKLILNNIATRIFQVNRIFSKRNIMTYSAATQKVVEELEKNPYFEKYANKITTLQKEDPDEFKQRVEAKAKSKIVKKSDETPLNSQYTNILKPKKALDVKKPIEETSLDKIMKVDLIRDKPTSEIKEIWQKYHIQKDVLSAIIPSSEYDKMIAKAAKYPTFLFPIPRSQGYEFMLSQFYNNTVHITPLICYQIHKENAPECLTLYHYTELKADKNIVLMRGEYDKNIIDAKEAQCLANQLQLYYTQNDPEKIKLMELFTSKPDEFKYSDLINQIETLTLN